MKEDKDLFDIPGWHLYAIMAKGKDWKKQECYVLYFGITSREVSMRLGEHTNWQSVSGNNYLHTCTDFQLLQNFPLFTEDEEEAKKMERYYTECAEKYCLDVYLKTGKIIWPYGPWAPHGCPPFWYPDRKDKKPRWLENYEKEQNKEEILKNAKIIEKDT